MAKKFWTVDKLKWAKDVALPTHRTVAEGLRAVELRYDRKCDDRNFKRNFIHEFGHPPSKYLALDLPAEHELLPPSEDPVLLNKRIGTLEKELKYAREENNIAALVRSLCASGIEELDGPTTFKPRRISAKKIRHGTPTIAISDVHHGEVVYGPEVNGVNEFNMQISRKRTQRVFERAVHMVDSVLSPSQYDEVVLALGGDMVSGNIHEEIRETNEVPIFDAVIDCLDMLRGGIEFLKGTFNRVRCECVVGNHGRLDKKPRMKHGPVDNYEYILYQLLKRDFAGDEDVIVNVSDAFTKHYEVRGTRFLLLHGDQFPGGTGIQGPLLPWHLGEHKLRKQMASMEGWTGKPLEFDVMVFGHFHQLTFMRTMICNGSIKGFDEFAKKRNFTFEQPQQGMWFTTDDRGITLPVALFAEDSPKHGK